MTSRIDYQSLAPDAIKAVYAVEHFARTSSLEPSLLHLVKLCASYANGCAYCVDMHTKEARAAGESEQRLFAIPVWRETPFFTARERTALAWTERVTLIAGNGVPDELFEEAATQFPGKQLVELTIAVIAINAWNRLAIPFHAEVGSYQPGAHRNGQSEGAHAARAG